MKNKNLRILSLALVLVTVISLVGCGKSKDDEETTSLSDGYSFQADQYTLESEEATEEEDSDTDSVGNVYNNNGGSSNYKPNNGNKNNSNSGNKNNNSNSGNKNNNTTKRNNPPSNDQIEDILDKNNGSIMAAVREILKNNPDLTFDKVLKMVNDAVASMKAEEESKKGEIATKIEDGVSDIYGKLTEYASNKATTAAPTKAAE